MAMGDMLIAFFVWSDMVKHVLGVQKTYRKNIIFRYCKCQYKNAQKVENKNVHFPRAIPRPVIP